jgi:plasmid stability protein
MSKDKDGWRQAVTVHLPDGIRRQLEAAAAAADRSLSAEVRRRIKQSLTTKADEATA